MFAILRALGLFVADLFKSRCRLEAENLVLRHQLNIALRRAPPRPRLFGSDRVLLVWITRFGRAFLVRCRWFSRRPSCVGTALAFAPFGVGSHEIRRVGPGLIAACVI
jgi:hypothetical protein